VCAIDIPFVAGVMVSRSTDATQIARCHQGVEIDGGMLHTCASAKLVVEIAAGSVEPTGTATTTAAAVLTV
jgi:hypothetical protein